MDYFAILGVEKGASSSEVLSAYRRLAKKYHPDRSKNPESLQKFQEISNAYEVLSDPLKREEYLRGQKARIALNPREFVSRLWQEMIEKKIKEEA